MKCEEELIIEEGQEATVTLKTPYKEVTSDSYCLFAIKDGEKMIEINKLSTDEVMDYINILQGLLFANKERLDDIQEGRS